MAILINGINHKRGYGYGYGYSYGYGYGEYGSDKKNKKKWMFGNDIT